MIINLSPQRRDDTITVIKTGDTITINGVAFDFSQLPEGATLPASAVDSEFFCGPVSRVGGELELTLLLPHGPNPSQAQAWPETITMTDDGDVPLPQDEAQPEEEEVAG